MSTVQVVLRKKPNKQNLLPISIRVTQNRKSTFLSLGQYISPKQWDNEKRKVRSSHPNSERLNNLILKKLYEINNKVIKIETDENIISINTIRKGISPEINYDFFDVAEMHISSLVDRNRFHQSQTEKSRIKLFYDFTGKKELAFTDITVSVLKKFESYLLYNKKLMPRTVMNYLIIIRTVYNRAIAESLANQINYPFGKGKIQIRFPETKKIGLNIEEIKLMENIEGITSAQQHALNVWLLSFYFAGIRIGDVLQLRWSDFRDNRLYYRMNKNQKLVSLKIPSKAQKILHLYKTIVINENDLIFDELKGVNFDDVKTLRTRTKTVNRNFNRRLEIIATKLGIEKKLTMHIARHSFGNISGDSIPIQMLQKLYRHSSITTTILYQANFIQKDADDALDKVVNF
jgi:integrase